MAYINTTIARPDAALSFGTMKPSDTGAFPKVIDLSKQDINRLTFEAHCKGYAGSGSASVKLQASDDGSTWADLGLSISNISRDGQYTCPIKGFNKRYIKAVITGAAGITGGEVETEINSGV